jgi:tetratricopeptide (TPR) repeat protein
MEAPPGHGPIWNFVNESSSGTIIFTWEPIGGNWYHQGKHKFFSGSTSDVFIEHIDGKKKTLKGLWGYDYLNTGLYLCKANGEFTKDSPCFLKFTKIEPNHSELVDKHGDIIHLYSLGFQSQGDYKKAIDDYNKTLTLNPNDKDARENLAQAKSQLFRSGVGGALVRR